MHAESNIKKHTGENYNNLVTTVVNSENHDGWVLLYFFLIIVINLFCVVPLLILRFDGAYSQIGKLQREKAKQARTNAMIASFIMLDANVSKSISRDEFEQIFRIADIYALPEFEEMSARDLSLEQYNNLILTHRLVDNNSIDSNVVITNRRQAWIECKIIYNPVYRWASLLFGIVPSLCAALLYGLSRIDEFGLNIAVVFSFVYNVFDIGIKMYALGGTPSNMVKTYSYDNNYKRRSCLEWMKRVWNGLKFWNFRYFHYSSFDDPPYVQWCIYTKQAKKPKAVPIPLSYLDHDDWIWCDECLIDNHVAANKSVWERKYETMVNLFDFVIIAVSLVGVIGGLWFLNGLNTVMYDQIGYLRMWLLLPLLRLFTLLEDNKKLTFELWTVVSNGNTFNISVFAILYILAWARLGVTLFYKKSDVVLEDIYHTEANTAFDSLYQGILLLAQIMIGDSWYELICLVCFFFVCG